jgi:hypothetical protein
VPVSRNAPPDYGGVGESLSAPPYDVEVMAVLLFKCPALTALATTDGPAPIYD